MIKAIKEKKILLRLVLISVITTPLFAILGATPFFRFDFQELNNFLPGILFTLVITLLFWLINISLLLGSFKIPFLKNIFFRALISILLGISVSAIGFHFYTPVPPPGTGRFITRASFPDNRIPGDPPELIQGDGIRLFNQEGAMKGAASFRVPSPKFFFYPLVLRLLTINIIVLTLCELVALHFRKQAIENENVLLRQMNLEAKNSQLMMQLHPHFLFNSLNTLRLLLKKDTDKAEDYLLKLSDILRFSTTAALANVVEVKDELKLCLNYLEMQKVRFGNMLHFYVTDPDLYHVKGQLPVYSLQQLAENAIKHNAFTEEAPLVIHIDYNKMKRMITVRNKVQPKQHMEQTTQTGLKNLENRYQLLNTAGIFVDRRNNEFAVSIKIMHLPTIT